METTIRKLGQRYRARDPSRFDRLRGRRGRRRDTRARCDGVARGRRASSISSAPSSVASARSIAASVWETRAGTTTRMSFKSFVGARDRRALLEEWRRKNGRKASNKAETSVPHDDLGSAREADAVSASRGNANVTRRRRASRRRRGEIRLRRDAWEGSGASKGDECKENNDSFVTPRSKTRGARGVEYGWSRAGGNKFRRAKTTPGSHEARGLDPYFPCRGRPERREARIKCWASMRCRLLRFERD